MFTKDIPYLVLTGEISGVFWRLNMMTSSNGNIFRVTGPLCGEFTGEFPSQRSVTQSFDAFFDLRQNKRLSKQSRRRWFETPSRSLWRHCNYFDMNHRRVVCDILIHAITGIDCAWYFNDIQTGCKSQNYVTLRQNVVSSQNNKDKQWLTLYIAAANKDRISNWGQGIISLRSELAFKAS